MLASFVFAVYCANGRLLGIGDTVPAALTPVVLLRQGNLRMDAFRPLLSQGKAPPYYLLRTPYGLVPKYPVATGLALVPLYAAPVWLYGLTHPSVADWLRFALIAEKIAAALIGAAAAGAFYLLALRLGASRGWALALSLAAAFGTEAWSTTSQALWQHGLGVLAILIAAWLTLRQAAAPAIANAVAFGGACAVAVAARPSDVLFALPMLAWFVALPAPRRQAMAAAAVVLPVVVGGALAAYNVIVFGDLLGGYAEDVGAGVGTSMLHALAGLLWSPGRGLLIYFPLALIGAAGAAWQVRRTGLARSIYGVWCIFVVAQVALLARLANWWGGYSYGPRLLADVQPFLLLFIVPLTIPGGWAAAPPQRRRALAVAFGILLVWSVALQAFGVFVSDGQWNALPVAIDLSPARLWDWRDNPVARDMPRLWRRAPPTPPPALRQWHASYGVPAAARLTVGETGRIAVEVTNRGAEPWIDVGIDDLTHQIHLSYRLRDSHGALVPGEKPRSVLGGTVGPGETVAILAKIEAPAEPGAYRLELTLVQEDVAWFDERGVAPARIDLTVVPRRPR